MSDDRAKKARAKATRTTAVRSSATTAADSTEPAAAAPAGTAATDAVRTAADAAAAAEAAKAAAEAAAANSEAGTGEQGDAPAEAEPPRTTRERLAGDALSAARFGAKGVQTVTLAGLRAVLPLIEIYAARRAEAEGEGDQTGRLGLTLGEQNVLKAAAQKAMVELLEITSRTDPIIADAPAYSRISNDGVAQTPSLVQLLSLAVAANRYFERAEKIPETEPAPAVPTQSVAYVAVAPGEYQATQGPLTPTEVRRSAMRERSYNTPRPAMLVYSAEGYSTAPATVYRRQSALASGAGEVGGYPAPAAHRAHAMTGGCCGGGYAKRNFAPARFEADGSCSPLHEISCETRWRVRECFKFALCDLLRCLGEELCDEDGRFTENPDLGACLERFVCSILTCLPEAICPSGGEEICCVPVDAISCGCNFAVGE